jgi:hypothetical protein
VQGLKIIIAGPAPFLSDAVRHAWFAAGIELLGPVPIATVERNEALKSNGVVIDISADPSVVFALSEKLEAWKVPFLYALPKGTLSARTGPYVLNEILNDIRAVVDALLRDYDEGVRH